MSLDRFAAFLHLRNGWHTTFNSRVACRSRWADADHSSVGVGGFYFANGSWSARLKSATWIFTFAIDTCFERRAISIGTTTNIDVSSGARCVWGSRESWWTLANGRVVKWFALLVFSTSIWQRARIGAETVDAGLFGRAIVEVRAANGFTACVWIATETGWTLTDSSVKDSIADSSTRASGWVTDGFALSVNTCVCSRTFFVYLTSDLVASDERITR